MYLNSQQFKDTCYNQLFRFQHCKLIKYVLLSSVILCVEDDIVYTCRKLLKIEGEDKQTNKGALKFTNYYETFQASC